MLAERFSFPVFLLKDVSALFYYDVKQFGITEEGVIIACYVGTGLGNAISIDGKLLDGHHGVAGELGHIPALGVSTVCGCGNTGCIEPLAGGLFLAKIQKETFPDTHISELFAKHATHPLLREYIKVLSMAIATEINILDPETVILGGGIVGMDGFPSDELEKNIRFHARKPLPEAKLKFVYSDNGGENGIIGAGIYARKQM
jgi:allose kinase